MPRPRARGRVAAGVYWNEARQRYHLRFRAVVYDDQVDGIPKPARRTVHSVQNVHRASGIPGDWEASLREAAQLRADIEAKLIERGRQDRADAARPVTFGEIARAYRDDAIDRGVRWDKEGSRWRVLVEEMGEGVPVEKITTSQLVKWRQNVKTRRNIKSRSVNAYVTLLNSIFNLAVRSGRVADNPARHLRPYEETKAEIEFLTHDQLQAVFSAAHRLQLQWGNDSLKRGNSAKRLTPIHDLVVALYFTAARTSNVLRLRWEKHVDFGAGVVVWQAGEVKNRRKVVVPMPVRLRSMLEARWPGPGAVGWVFPHPHTSEPFRNIRAPWLAAIAGANASLDAANQILPTFKVYNLRHTRATHFLAATGDYKATADLLGDTVKMVEDRYAGRNVPGLRVATERAASSPELAKIDGVKTVTKLYRIDGDQPPTDDNPEVTN